MKNCKICKIEFKPLGKQKCCSDKCSKINEQNYQRIYAKSYYPKNKVSCKRNQKKYNDKNQEKLKDYREIYARKHRAEQKEYRRIHLKYASEQSRKYRENRRKRDINFRIRCNLSGRIRCALKGINTSKSTIKLLGCRIEFLKVYLSNKFTKGMSWENYGKWHVDHIRPCAKFDLTKTNEQHKCFHYTNLQPLWAIDNIKKGKKYEDR
jgi:hypothetical protein